MGIFDIFSITRGANMQPQPVILHNNQQVPNQQVPPGQQQPNQQTQGGNDPSQANNGGVNNNAAPGTVGNQNQGKSTTPLDNLDGIWDTDPNAAPDAGQFKFPSIDPAKLG